MDYYNSNTIYILYKTYNRNCNSDEYIEYVRSPCKCECILNGEYHNTRGAALTTAFKTEGIREIYYRKGVIRNTRGPSIVWYFPNGRKSSEEYSINGVRHNEKGPAIVYYYKNGEKMMETYYINGVLHNSNGPAYIGYDVNGDVIEQQYWIHGNRK